MNHNQAEEALKAAKEDVAARDVTLSAQAAQIAQLLKDAESAKASAEKLSAALSEAERRITEQTERLSSAEERVKGSEENCDALTQELDKTRAELENNKKSEEELRDEFADSVLPALAENGRDYFKRGWDAALREAGVPSDSPLFQMHIYVPSEEMMQAEAEVVAEDSALPRQSTAEIGDMAILPTDVAPGVDSPALAVGSSSVSPELPIAPDADAPALAAVAPVPDPAADTPVLDPAAMDVVNVDSPGSEVLEIPGGR